MSINIILARPEHRCLVYPCHVYVFFLFHSLSPDNGILRLPILYSEVKDLEESAVTCLFPKVKDTSKPCVMSDYERRFPTNCDDVAYVVRELAEKRLQVIPRLQAPRL